jgi:hypothetical protein
MLNRSGQGFIRSGARGLAACAFGIVAGAASPVPPQALSLQLADAGALQQGVAPQTVHAPAQKASMQPATYQPAPIPDPDAGPPAASDDPKTPSLLPSMLSEKRIFEGDGYAYSSSQQGALNHRTQPAAGLNLSVPVGQQVGHAPGGGD